MVSGRRARVALMLSTYPIEKPQHGGQVRVANLADTYSRYGWEIYNVAVLPDESYSASEYSSSDIIFPMDSPFRSFDGKNIPFMTDYLSGIFATEESSAFDKVTSYLPSHLDVIHVEQPWLWPLAEKIKSLPQHSRTMLVYGSQNIEMPLKKSIFDDYGITSSEALIAIDLLEKKAVKEADLVLAVTSDDLLTLKEWGAKETLLLPNGISSFKVNPTVAKSWKAKLPCAPWLLYVASAHPPNFSRFTEILGESLGCIPPNSKLVVAGSVSEHIYRVLAQTKWAHLNLSRLELLYILSDEDLAAVKSLAHGYFLPIPFGGGSNIKTAEALYSGSFVVGTPSAFRGFGDYTKLPEVYIGNNPSEIHSAIRDVLQRPRSQGNASSSSTADREMLLWRNCLAALPSKLKSFLEKGPQS